MKKFFVPLLVASVVFVVSCNNSETKDSTEVAKEQNEQKADSTNAGDDMEDDQEFMVEAASGGLMEVQLGEAASKNAASAKVKEFGRRMVKDHTKANGELKSLAAKKNVTLPQTPGADHQKHIDDMKTKKGADFDKDYMSMMVDDHEKDVRKFENAANNAKDAELKAFASKTLPVLREHLQMAKTINDGLKR
jgi:putative membrane protein